MWIACLTTYLESQPIIEVAIRNLEIQDRHPRKVIFFLKNWTIHVCHFSHLPTASIQLITLSLRSAQVQNIDPGGLRPFCLYSRVLIYNSSVRIHSTYILLWREGRERELINKSLSPSVYLCTITYYLLFLGPQTRSLKHKSELKSTFFKKHVIPVYHPKPLHSFHAL